ncbi:4-diphosphocytidyl-2C-methyl-D-erythritol synthase [Streptomyces sp. WAC 06725]|uniref:nucleotidyltransferase family protein n=1 Tax=Streptomyces sp. WAC 06725 TaxID=2203209 RepID=UPI000F748E36|nr:nucleotidyltransferase family protein [Streptomyces sp. WAC 06725]RSO51181.1 4-diphosphocytidyl-2C-methyl-D-erythritol synthase [Streptomyces sp. WAC 06725]
MTHTAAPASTPSPAHRPVAGLLLAAGGGRRLGGRPKALLDFRGRPLVEHAARVLREGGCDRVLVVLGAAAETVRARADLSAYATAENPDWAHGMGSSLRVGLAALADSGAGAALVSLVDQPGIGAAAVARVIAAYEGGADLVAAAYDGKRGHPVLFGAGRWAAVAAGATGDRGARAYLKEHEDALTLVECADVAEPYDIDTPRDLFRLASPGAPRAGEGR